MKNLVLIFLVCFVGNLFSQKFKLTDTVGRINNGNDFLDSLKREYIQVESIKKLNKIRKDLGMKPLIYDERLKPAAYHNIVYNRYCQWNRIFQPGEERSQGNNTLTHTQRVDIPNFTEILWPDQRISLLEKGVFQKITEELTQDISWPTWTFDEVTNRPWDRYKVCSAHWNALTKSTEWDAVYFYHDTKTGLHVVILGKYLN